MVIVGWGSNQAWLIEQEAERAHILTMSTKQSILATAQSFYISKTAFSDCL